MPVNEWEGKAQIIVERIPNPLFSADLYHARVVSAAGKTIKVSNIHSRRGARHSAQYFKRAYPDAEIEERVKATQVPLIDGVPEARL